MPETAGRRERYARAALRLHDHLERQLHAEHGYPDAPTWGYAFSVLLSAAVGMGSLGALGTRATAQLQRQLHHDRSFPWEFVVYAVQRAKRLLTPGVPLPFDEHRRRGTRMFNWFLLRQVNRGWFAGHGGTTLLKLRAARRLYTTRDGQILDELRTRSLQYHAFCLFLLCELVDQHPEAEFLRSWLHAGARFSAAQVLSDGTALWIGRGQEQIFGYGALVYALEYVNDRVATLDDAAVLDRLQRRVLSFQRDDGSFPLVLRRREPEPPHASVQTWPLGWYGYNTLYDYQPFLAYTLWRTSQLGRPS